MLFLRMGDSGGTLIPDIVVGERGTVKRIMQAYHFLMCDVAFIFGTVAC